MLTAVLIAATTLQAEDAYVTSCIGTVTLNSCPPSCPINRGTATLTSSVSSAPGPATRDRACFAVSTSASWQVTPTLLQSSGVYKIYITKGTSGNGSPNLVVSMTTTNGDLADIAGVASASVSLTNFNSFSPNSVWTHVGYITNNSATPMVAFTYVSGTAASTGGRWYMDAVRFENLDPCTGVAPLVTVTGPAAAGQAFVNVAGVAAGATNVTVYADNGSGPVQIGLTNFAGGFAAGIVAVPTSALIKDDQLTATQIKPNGVGTPCTSTAPASGPKVGGGANPKIKVSLGLLQNATLAGPAGTPTPGTGATASYWLKATGTFGSASATAPVGGAELTPGECWQTITFDWSLDPAVNWQSNIPLTDNNPYAALEHLAITLGDSDTGPYDIYIDSIKNGDVVIEDFEGFTNNAPNVTFQSPNTATLPIPGNQYMGAPNSSAISQNYVYDGTNACRVQWQFSDTLGARWVRLLAGSTIGHRYPQLDKSKPVTVRMLVLAPGQNTSQKFTGTIQSITNSVGPIYTTMTNTVGVTVTGPGTYTYQWNWSGGGLPNSTTDRTYTIDGGGSGASTTDNGIYTVTVSDGTCSESRSIRFTAVNPAPTITNQPDNAIIVAGATATVMTVEANGHVPAGYPLSYVWRLNDNDIPDLDPALNTLSITNASLANAGHYTVVVGNAYGSVTSSIAALSVTTVAPGTGTGLSGAYYTLHFQTNYVPFAGAPTLSRTDSNIHFNWGNGSPDPSISADHFTARWYGKVQALGDDNYQFVTRTDDGVRLWVNGQLLVDKWVNQGATSWTNSIALTGSSQYDVVMEYYENAVAAVAELNWFTDSGSIPHGAVPMSQLIPGTFVSPTVALTAPANQTTNTLPPSVGLAATVTTNSAYVDKVQFLTNGVVLAETDTPPYTYSWVSPAPGVYNVSARVIYNLSSAAGSGTNLLAIIGTPASPVSASISGTTLNYSGGGGVQFVLLKSTDITTPLSAWTRVATNASTPGSFVLPVGSEPKAFYAVKSE